MQTYVILLRGINVGGKNKVPMAALRTCLQDLGFKEVVTYIASGNAVLRSDMPASTIRQRIERALPQHFELDSERIKALVLTRQQLRSVIERKPTGFGEQPNEYHSDAIFLIDTEAAQALPVFNPQEGVDQVWAGEGVIYSQRLSAQRTKSRLSTIMSSPLYKCMTIRNWNTATKLLALADTLTP